MLKEFKLDANEQAYFAKQLTYIESQALSVLYPELKARTVLPYNTQVDGGAQNYEYHMYDMVGEAKIIADNARDLPRVDIKGKPFPYKIRTLGDSFGYTVMDIKAAAFSGFDLNPMRAMAARQALLQKENKIAFFGDADHGLFGLLAHPNIPHTTVTGGVWDTKTADQILLDIDTAVQAQISASNAVHMPNAMLLPSSRYAKLMMMPRSTNSDMTLLEFIRANFGFQFIDALPYELNESGPGGEAEFVLYTRDSSKLSLLVPVDFTQMEPQLTGLEYEVPCYQTCGGLIVPYPKSVTIRYGI